MARAQLQGEQVKGKLDEVSLKLSAVSGSMRDLTERSRTELREASQVIRSSGVKGLRKESKADIRKAERLLARYSKLHKSLDRELVLIRETAAALKLAKTTEETLPLIHILENSAKRVDTNWHKARFVFLAILAMATIALLAYAIWSAPAILAGLTEFVKSLGWLSANIGTMALKIGAGFTCTAAIGLALTGIGLPWGLALGSTCAGLLWAARGGTADLPPIPPGFSGTGTTW
jgi:hypothetical protein